ncbi:Upstream activation factor subunit spp27 [Vanrija pseudolonga]|uniref:Upstream activation factor subunit spp27 n=1 Tax=Vanrija pseudolonga TaxID=143232 RepID=A0AAF1BMM7_9TREE|nr:Upstream activation factor subunit spp27 [Vanrija pseudolonga]
MTSAYVAGLVPRIRQILKSSDLSTISAKGVRKTLIGEGEDEAIIKENRKDIDAQIAIIYEEFCKDEEASESSEDEPLTNNRRDSASHHHAHPPSSQPEPLKKKAKTEPKHEQQVESDEAMAARMQAEFDEMVRGGRGQRSTSKAKTKIKKSKSASKKKRSASDIEDSDDEKPKKRGGGGGGGVFNKELILSDALGGWLGEERLSRPQTVKRIWEYVKANGLQDQSDKRFILCDSEMQRVFNTEKLHMFTMNKLLSAHFRDPDEVV